MLILCYSANSAAILQNKEQKSYCIRQGAEAREGKANVVIYQLQTYPRVINILIATVRLNMPAAASNNIHLHPLRHY